MTTALEKTSMSPPAPQSPSRRSVGVRAVQMNIGKEASKVPTSIEGVKQKLSATLLKSSWRYLIPSFGLTFLYILFHFICAYIAGWSWFCKFGKEWPTLAAAPGASTIVEYAEIFIVLIVTISVAISILSNVVIYVAIVAFVAGLFS